VLPRILPFLPEPKYRAFAANVAGDAGFDPIGLCTDGTKFVNYREAELKHGRLAMLAALAWPIAEIVEPEVTEKYGLPDILADTEGRVLPQLTGGIEDTFVEGFISVALLVGAVVELLLPRVEGARPGDLGLDPFGFGKWRAPSSLRSLLPRAREWMPEAEVKHGRLAMMAVLYDILDEVLTGNPVVEDTEYFFHRLDSKFFRWEYWTFQPELLEAPPLDL